jgi:hypothetical protein
MRASAPAWITNGLLVLGGIVLMLLCVEGIFAFALSHPEILASKDGTVGDALAYARDYYANQDRKLVQYLADCAQYDREVTYTLIPGRKCRVASREYVVEYAGNRAGLRDGDEALSRPEIVVVGDSHAMGWGVRGEESFPKRLQAMVSRPVLNASMSSYGTVREMMLLERLVLPSTRTLVIQYSDNDFIENRPFVERGALDILPEWQYRAVVREHRLGTRYYPFKYTSSLLSIDSLAAPWRRPPSPQSDNVDEAPYFLEVLLRHRAGIEGRTVVVIEINAYNRNDGRFVSALRGLLAQPRYAPLARWVTAIDVSRALGPADYYVLDGHMRAAGHEKVARLVAAELERRKALGP